MTVLRSAQKVFIVVNLSFSNAVTPHGRKRIGSSHRVESQSEGKNP